MARSREWPSGTACMTVEHIFPHETPMPSLHDLKRELPNLRHERDQARFHMLGDIATARTES